MWKKNLYRKFLVQSKFSLGRHDLNEKRHLPVNGRRQWSCNAALLWFLEPHAKAVLTIIFQLMSVNVKLSLDQVLAWSFSFHSSPVSVNIYNTNSISTTQASSTRMSSEIIELVLILFIWHLYFLFSA